jgi:hypothetical protein
MAEKPQCGKNVAVARRGQDQQLRHESSKLRSPSLQAPRMGTMSA